MSSILKALKKIEGDYPAKDYPAAQPYINNFQKKALHRQRIRDVQRWAVLALAAGILVGGGYWFGQRVFEKKTQQPASQAAVTAPTKIKKIVRPPAQNLAGNRGRAVPKTHPTQRSSARPAPVAKVHPGVSGRPVPTQNRPQKPVAVKPSPKPVRPAAQVATAPSVPANRPPAAKPRAVPPPVKPSKATAPKTSPETVAKAVPPKAQPSTATRQAVPPGSPPVTPARPKPAKAPAAVAKKPSIPAKKAAEIASRPSPKPAAPERKGTSMADLAAARENAMKMAAESKPKPSAARRPSRKREPIRINSHPRIELQAIAWAEDPQARFVVINNRIAREGDKVDNVVILEIKPDSIVFQEGTSQWEQMFTIK